MNETLDHLEEGELQALADGELGRHEAERVEAHLAECAGCRSELDSLHQAGLALTGALRSLDRPIAEAPPFRARKPDSSKPVVGWSSLPRAAVLVLGLAGAASAAIPGSPVRAWLESLIDTEQSHVPTPAPVAPPREPVPEAPEAGISIGLENGAVRIVLGEVDPGVVVTAVLSESPRAGVYATGAAAHARFTTGRGRIEVVGAPSGTLRVEIPQEAGSAILTLNGGVYVVKEGDRLRVDAPGAETTGTEVTFRVR